MTVSTSISYDKDHHAYHEGNITTDTLSDIQTQKDRWKEMDVIWVLLTLSLVSIGLHLIILVHVRSTAPTDDAMQRNLEGAQRVNHTSVGKKRKMLAYWIYDRYRRDTYSTNHNVAIDHFPHLTSSSHETTDRRRTASLVDDNANNFDGFHSISPLTSSFRDDLLGNESSRSQLRKRESNRSTDNGDRISNIVETFSEGYDEFISEIRHRFQDAKKEWSQRLDDVKIRMTQQHETNSQSIFYHFNTSNTPFKSLLRMYAHEEVFQNHILDQAFPIQGNSLALSFYAPQLLCFLLHNAYLSTGKLERWILDRCKNDLRFAHRCFWFLRSWCLQGGIFRPEEYHGAEDDQNSVSSMKSLHETDEELNQHVNRSFSAPDFSNIRDLVQEPLEKDIEKSRGMKYHSDERKSLEKLLSKIISNGEHAARSIERLQPASNSHHQSKEITTISDYSGSLFHDDYPSLSLRREPLFHSDSSLRQDLDGKEVRSCFLRTPDFLDSLLAIADDLLLQEPLQRTLKLRERLKELNSSMLPSETIYVPVNNALHQVWRIVDTESIAISTKERVPCIIYLEVIDNDMNGNQGADSVLRRWYKLARPPQRLNTILDKMSDFTQKGLQKLQQDLEKKQEHLFGSRSAGLEDPESLSLLSEESNNFSDIETPSTPHSDEFQSSNSLGQWLSPDMRKVSDESLVDNDDSYGSTHFPLRRSNHDDKEFTENATLPIVFKESFKSKQERIKRLSAKSMCPNWRLLPILIKSNDDLRQEQLASQLIHGMATILSRAKIPVWLYPYEIVALSFRGGVMEAIPDTISIDSLRKNYPHFSDLTHFYNDHFGDIGSDGYENAKANFMESLAAYSIVCFIMQIKDRHNGNILIDNQGHLIHIDFGFFFLSSPGKNSGFESAPFKLTKDFIDLIGGSHSHSFHRFRSLCFRTFLELRKNCFEITLLVQMLMEGNEDLNCFRGRPHDAIKGMQERFRLDLSDKACQEYVNRLIDDSIENWTTTCYDRYQRCFVGVM